MYKHNRALTMLLAGMPADRVAMVLNIAIDEVESIARQSAPRQPPIRAEAKTETARGGVGGKGLAVAMTPEEQKTLERLDAIHDAATRLAPIELTPAPKSYFRKARWERSKNYIALDRMGILKKGFYGSLGLAVATSPDLLERGMAIMYSIVKACQGLGGKVLRPISPQYEFLGLSGTVIEFAGAAPVGVRVREWCAQNRESGKRPFPISPIGKLVVDTGPTFRCGREFYASEKHKDVRIEDRLNEIVASIVHEARKEWKKERHYEAEKRAKAEAKISEQLRIERREAALAELSDRQAAEQQRIDDLVGAASGWRQARLIREFVDEVESRRVSETSSNGRRIGWGKDDLEWARSVADRLDPFASTPDSVMDERLPDSE